MTGKPEHRVVLAIDPGPELSGWVLYRPAAKRLLAHDITCNTHLRGRIRSGDIAADVLVLERVSSLGMPVGEDVFLTCFEIGKFEEAFDGPCELIKRPDVKLTLCGHVRAKDSNVRQVLIDRFGPGKERAIGRKKCPGPLFGVRRDEWAALALAIAYQERTAQSAAMSRAPAARRSS